jgi:hypothetical protein
MLSRVPLHRTHIYTDSLVMERPPLWSSAELMATDPEVRFRFPAIPDFLRSSGPGTGSAQPREYN